MFPIDSLDDISALKEGIEIECKLAQGRNGKGALPKDFWETYSAFANTTGGDLIIGIEEEKGIPNAIEGIVIDDIDKYKNKLDSIIRDSIIININIGVPCARHV